MRLWAGHHVLDTDSEYIKYLGKHWQLKKSLYKRVDGVYFELDESEETPVAKVLDEKQAFKLFYKIHGEVLNYKWIFREVFSRDWSMDLIRKPRHMSKKS